jgi:hypothetical protein
MHINLAKALNLLEVNIRIIKPDAISASFRTSLFVKGITIIRICVPLLFKSFVLLSLSSYER